MKKIDLRCKIFTSTLVCVATICAGIMLSSCQKDPTGEPDPNPAPTPPPPTVSTAVEKMDSYLKERYLWNDEYKSLKTDKSLAYDVFLSTTLKSMKTNTLDNKFSNGEFHLYSFIERVSNTDKSGNSRAVIERPKHNLTPVQKLSYGIASLFIFNHDIVSNGQGISISGIYPDSPAQKAELKRGAMITKFNGTAITKSNIMDFIEQIYFTPTQGTVVLTDEYTRKSYTITSSATYENPALKSEVITDGNHKIGYLVYSSFDAAYDGELLAAIKILKDDGITDLILDFRLNGGGHVVSSDMLSSAIAGTASQNKVFQYYRYNDTRMANTQKTSSETGNKYDVGVGKFYDNFSYPTYYGVDLSKYALNLNTPVYCIVTGSTASSSEAVINSLKGIGVTVRLIGDKTSGKNVGMEPKEFSDDKYDYTFYPITFQSYNAAGATVTPTGIIPDYQIDEWNGGNDFADFTKDEVCVAKAISLITGTPIVAKVSSRSTQRQLSARAPIVNPHKPQGAIMLPRQ